MAFLGPTLIQDGRGGNLAPCLFSLASTALLIKKEDLRMIRVANLVEMLGGDGVRLNKRQHFSCSK